MGRRKTAASKPAESLFDASSAAGRPAAATDWLSVLGARHNNLKGIDVHFPLGRFVAVTGVSGSGKSSLVNDILRAALENTLNGAASIAGEHDAIVGTDQLDKIIDIDQSPIGRTPRSNPATYIKVFDRIRDLYTRLPEAKTRGYQPGRFSFNVSGGRCEACEGNGSNRLEMDFLADVWITCPVCEGRRFNRETLHIRFKDKSIHDVLEMDVQEALDHFENISSIRNMVKTLHDVGLDYLKLGQPSPTLSGGEAQRIKLARELCKRSTGRTMYVLDEPTTGLHFDDVRKLLAVLHGFVDAGNSVIVIEHNLDVIKTADWIIDLGPEGGAGGGRIIAEGSPEQVAAFTESHTGQALRTLFNKKRSVGRAAARGRSKQRGVTAANPKIQTHLEVEGASQHNLKEVSVSLPLGRMSVFSGPSGSGKTSLAIDTLYAEGQRRYVESLSSYARQFLGQMQKPKVERISGLPPAISIEQKAASKSPRSTVGTVTEIYDYFRILMARLGQPYCPNCQIPIGTQTTEEIIDKLMLLPEDTRLYLLAPVDASHLESLWEDLKRTGFVRMRVDGVTYDIASPPALDARRKHTVEVIVDRVSIRHSQRGRLADSVEAALDLGRGILNVAFVDAKTDERRWKVDRYSQHLACDRCGKSFVELSPNSFSFNSPLGWCPSCEGLGVQAGGGAATIATHMNRSLRHGALPILGNLIDDESPFVLALEAVGRHLGFSLDEPFEEIAPDRRRAILYGTGDDWIELGDGLGTKVQYKGIFPAITEAARVSWVFRQRLAGVVEQSVCSTCQGSRLRSDAAAVRFADRTIHQWCSIPLADCRADIDALKLSKVDRQIAGEVFREIRHRLEFLVDVGLGYLTLDRSTPTLSGGEAQRIRLASQLGSGLTGVLYLLDEPTIGLHPRDTHRLLGAIKKLRDLGNTLVLVEHDREVIEAADHLVDFGPGAGRLGGAIVAAGKPRRIVSERASLTGKYLAGSAAIAVPATRREGSGASLVVKGASHHNLADIDVEFPLGKLIAVTGVSGSGKSSLVGDILWAALARRLHRASTTPGIHEEILGIENVDKVINVDQQPIGNTPMSNPATYTGAFDLIRELFARLPEAKIRGYHPSRFSFNKPGGRCEACEGNGQKKVEMHFLPDVWVECDVCGGKRYTPETLAVTFKGKSIADVLAMTVGESRDLFENIPKIKRLLETLCDVGLDYMPLGQPAPTLSGGEAQRVKLAAELARPNTGKTLYILDEPTTGLHFDDVRKLLEVLHRLVDLGNTVIVIEHNLDVIKTSDWVIDMGPEAGEDGGRLVFAGTPEDLAERSALAGDSPRKVDSHTGAALAPVLAMGPRLERTAPVDPSQGDAQELPLFRQIEAAVSANVKMPWEVDGRRWHTVDRVSRTGKPCQWDGEALGWLIDKIEGFDCFRPANWNDRSLVEIGAQKRSDGWFFHALTGEEWLLQIKFRVRRGTFKTDLLSRELGLLPLDQMTEIPRYGSEPRVRVRQARGVFQEVAMTVFRAAEIKTDAFRAFLGRAVQSFQKATNQIAEATGAGGNGAMAGEDWHRSTKGFKPGRRALWDRAVIDAVIRCIEQATPDATWDWAARDSVKRRFAGIGQAWARLMTKQHRALELILVGKKGQFNLAAIDQFGAGQELRTNNASFDAIRLSFLGEDDLSSQRFIEFLESHAAGFVEALGKADAVNV